MKFKKLVEEIKAPKGKGIIIFDIDDTLTKAKGIYIYKQMDGKDVKKLTPEQFAKEDVKAEKEKGFIYDYRDFDNPNKLYNSIIQGEPIIKNLRVLDAHLRAGWDIGFLTARSGESANKKAINDWLKYRGQDGELKPIPRNRVKYFIAINDPKRKEELKKMVKNKGDFDAKKVYLDDIKKKYDTVKFIDDDDKNIRKAKDVLHKKNVIKAQ